MSAWSSVQIAPKGSDSISVKALIDSDKRGMEAVMLRNMNVFCLPFLGPDAEQTDAIMLVALPETSDHVIITPWMLPSSGRFPSWHCLGRTSGRGS